jgi:hypothetical protein
MSTETKTEEKKEETKKSTKHSLPDGYITPVQATHRLKKEAFPEDHARAGERYADDSLNSQFVYTLTKSKKTNKCPVGHFDAEGKMHDEPQTDDDGNVITRPGLHWDGNEQLDSFRDWFVGRPKRGSKVPAGSSEEKGEKSEPAERPEVADSSEEDELDELDDESSDEDEEMVEAE